MGSAAAALHACMRDLHPCSTACRPDPCCGCAWASGKGAKDDWGRWPLRLACGLGWSHHVNMLWRRYARFVVAWLPGWAKPAVKEWGAVVEVRFLLWLSLDTWDLLTHACPHRQCAWPPAALFTATQP